LTEIRQDYDFKAESRSAYRKQLVAFIKEKNPAIDTSSKAFGELADRLAQIVDERNGHLVADDYNFAVRAFNDRPKTK
jgi:hypothetical protein